MTNGTSLPDVIRRPTFAIGIPTINQYADKLKGYLEDYDLNFPNITIYILDNGKQGIDVSQYPNMILIENDQPAGVAESWNMLCRMIFLKHTHALILNDDVFLGCEQRDVIGFILTTIYNNAEANYPMYSFLASQRDFCVFIIPYNIFEFIGWFDENFKGAYFEDKDYERRLQLAKIEIKRIPELNPKIFHQSSSIGKDKSLNDNFQNNYEYYKKKWGGSVGGETYTSPWFGLANQQAK